MQEIQSIPGWEKVTDSLTEMSIQMTFIKDVETDVILFVNEAAAAAIGFSRSDIIGQSSSKFYPEHAEFNADDREIIKSGKAKVKYRENYTDVAGRVHQLLSTKWPIKVDGRNLIAIAAIDVTILLEEMTEATDVGRSYDSKVFEETKSKHYELLEALYER